MASKNFEIQLTPQNDEWVKLIPNSDQNMHLIMNKLIEHCIDDGVFLAIISKSLTLADLIKFKSAYSKLHSKRMEYITALDIRLSQQLEVKKPIQMIEDIQPQIFIESSDEVSIPTPPIQSKKANKSGFTEDAMF